MVHNVGINAWRVDNISHHCTKRFLFIFPVSVMFNVFAVLNVDLEL